MTDSKIEKPNQANIEQPPQPPIEVPKESAAPMPAPTNEEARPAAPTSELPVIEEKSVPDNGPIEDSPKPDSIESIPGDLEEREKLASEKFKSNNDPKDLAAFANSLLHQEK